MNKKTLTISLVVIAAISVIFYFLNANAPSKGNRSHGNKPSHPKELKWSYKVVELENGWGYEIQLNGKRNILQNRIPAIPFKQPFTSKQSAEKVALKVMEKLNSGKIPSMSQKELIDMGIVDSLLRPIPGLN